MTTLVFSHREWKKLKARICDEYGPNFFLIRYRVERELGFTTRSHSLWNDTQGWQKDIRLDFSDPAQATFFQIKYL